MGLHDIYGKGVLRRANPEIEVEGPNLHVYFEIGHPAQVDGVLPDKVAIEIEARNSTQVLGAEWKLCHHRAPGKLLILIPQNKSKDLSVLRRQCEHRLSKYLNPAVFRVIESQGTGYRGQLDDDAACTRQAIDELVASVAILSA